jgi:hypothetical protein
MRKTYGRTLANVCLLFLNALPTNACWAGVGPLTLVVDVAAASGQAGTRSGWLKAGFSFGITLSFVWITIWISFQWILGIIRTKLLLKMKFAVH